MGTPNFNTELAKRQFQGNVVLQIDGVYYSQYQVDSGLTVDADKIGLIRDISINGIQVDIRDVQTSVSTVNFALLDKNGSISVALGINNSWMSKQVKVYFGFITGSFAWADYSIIAEAYINGLSKLPNVYNIKAKDLPSLMQTRIFTTLDTLDGAIDNSQTTLTLNDATNFPTSGRLKIDDEFFQYSGKTGNDLTGLTRADLSSQADNHDDESRVDLVIEKQDNAMDMLLDIMENEIGISPTLIDTVAFTDLRDGIFAADGDFLFYLYDIEDGLKWLEENILLATNTRFVTNEGKISIAVLDQVDFDTVYQPINEDHIQGNPSYSINADKIVNKVIVNWGWSEGLQKFSRVSTFSDADSIADYGDKKDLILDFKGVQPALGGAAIVSDRANRILARMATPMAEIGVTTHFNRHNINIGDKVELTHRYLPSEGGALGMFSLLEVLSKAPSGFDDNAKIQWKLAFTSFSGLRIGFIAPSPLPTSVTSQTVFDVPDGSCYRVGYFLKLWDDAGSAYYADAANQIIDITGNTITMQNAFTTTLNTSNTRIKFADYDESSLEQRGRYAYIAPNSGFFVSDGSKAYQIII